MWPQTTKVVTKIIDLLNKTWKMNRSKIYIYESIQEYINHLHNYQHTHKFSYIFYQNNKTKNTSKKNKFTNKFENELYIFGSNNRLPSWQGRFRRGDHILYRSLTNLSKKSNTRLKTRLCHHSSINVTHLLV